MRTSPAEWLAASVAPSNGDHLEVCVLDYDGIVHALALPCPFRKEGAESIDASGQKHADMQSTHWRKRTERH